MKYERTFVWLLSKPYDMHTLLEPLNSHPPPPPPPPLDKMAAISQTTFSSAFSWMKSFVFWLKFHLCLLLGIQLTISQHWFWWWFGTKQLTSHYLNQCWPNPWMHICVTRGRWGNVTKTFLTKTFTFSNFAGMINHVHNSPHCTYNQFGKWPLQRSFRLVTFLNISHNKTIYIISYKIWGVCLLSQEGSTLLSR